MLLWSMSLTPVPMCLVGRKPRRTKVSASLIPAPVLSPSRCGAQLLSTSTAAGDCSVSQWVVQEQRQRCTCALHEGSGTGKNQADNNVGPVEVRQKSAGQLVRNMAYSYAFLGGRGEQFQQDSTIFVNVLISLFRAYLNAKIFTVRKELPQGNVVLGSNI